MVTVYLTFGELPICFPDGCTIFHSHQYLVWSILLILAILGGAYLIVALVCFSLMMSVFSRAY